MSHCISAVLWLTTATFFFYIFPVNCVMAMSHRFEREIGLTKDRMTHSTKTQHNEENDEASKKKKWKRKKKRKTLTESKRRNKMKLMTDWNPPKAMNESEAERRMRVCERLGAKDERSKWCYLMSLSFYCIETWPSSTEKNWKDDGRWRHSEFNPLQQLNEKQKSPKTITTRLSNKNEWKCRRQTIISMMKRKMWSISRIREANVILLCTHPSIDSYKK